MHMAELAMDADGTMQTKRNKKYQIHHDLDIYFSNPEIDRCLDEALENLSEDLQEICKKIRQKSATASVENQIKEK